jgi:hypothetical protein
MHRAFGLQLRGEAGGLTASFPALYCSTYEGHARLYRLLAL